jgi:acyl carrier protein
MIASSPFHTQDIARLDIARRLLRLASDVISPNVSSAQVSEDTSFFDLGLVSLNVVELLSAVEREFDVVVDGDELSAELFMRFGNVVAFVQKKMAERR